MSDQTPPPTTTNPTPLRTVLWINIAWVAAGIVAGVVIALLLIIAVELSSAVVHPLPPNFGGTQEEMCAHVARYPAWVLALVVPAWALTAFAGTWTANHLGACPAALFVGLLLTAAVLSNVTMLPYPIWFKILAVVGVMTGVRFAVRIRR